MEVEGVVLTNPDRIRSNEFRLGGVADRLAAPDPWADYPAVRQAITAPAKRRLGL